MIKLLGTMDEAELISSIRRVPLLKPAVDGSLIYPYKSARIVIREVDPRELCASAFYVIEHKLAFQRELRAALLPSGYDTLRLRGALRIENESGEHWSVLPPVVELLHEEVAFIPRKGELDYSKEHASVAAHIVTDGMHRVFTARELGETVHVIHIAGAASDYPYYAHPNGWNEVKVYTDTPSQTRLKKRYRREQSYDLFRNLDVLGCGKPRYVGSGTVVTP